MERRQQYCPWCGSPVGEQARSCGTCAAALTTSSSSSFVSGYGQPEGAPATDAPDAEGSVYRVPLMPPIPTYPSSLSSSPASDAVSDAPQPPSAPVSPAAPNAPAYAYPYPYVYPGPAPYPGAAAYPYGSAQPGQQAYPYGSSLYNGAAGANGTGGAPPAIGGGQGMAPAPGYPAYPQGMPAAYAPYAPPAPGYPASGYSPYGYGVYGYLAYGYSYPYAYPAYPYPMYWKPPRAPGETLALVISWIVTVFGGLSIVCGMFVGLALALVALAPTGEGLATLAVLVELTVAPIVAGGFAIYFGICGILRKPSPRFSIPSPLFFLALTILVLGAGVVLWHLMPAPGSPELVLPVIYLAGILPAFAILAFTARRLGLPSTRRHVWMSLLYGLTLAPLLALILELVAGLIIGALSGIGSSALSAPTNIPNTGLLILITLLLVSVVAPLVEEGVKPLGAVLLMRRVRTPASAFLLGMAAGVGFDIFETIGYIGQGQADWITIAIERVGAGLLHGVGAGMAALGWYYLINGRGVSGRWMRGIGCIFYAVAQHAIFNGIFVVSLVPGLGNWLSQPWYIGQLPFQNGDFLDFALYVIILGVLYVVTGRLARGARPPDTAVALPEAGPSVQTTHDAGTTAVGSGVR